MHRFFTIALLILIGGAFGQLAVAQNAASEAAGPAQNVPRAAEPATMMTGRGCGLRFEPEQDPPGQVAAAPDQPDRPHRITVHVTRSDNSVLSGPVTITGMPVGNAPADIGTVDWAVSGSTVSGAVTGQAGNPVTTFEGTITDAGVAGNFMLPGGRGGKWSWDGPLPK